MSYSYESFLKFQGKGIPYRGRCDDIIKIIRVLLEDLPKNDEKLNRQLINGYYLFNYINEINTFYDTDFVRCFISYDEGEVSFNSVPEHLKSRLGLHFYDILSKKYCFVAECHEVTLKYLMRNRHENLRAVTSLCVNIDNILYFHSYIWNVDTDEIIDFARNIVMKKSDYDSLFCYKEINVLSYDDYVKYLGDAKREYCSKDYLELLFLALVTLLKEKSQSEFDINENKKVFTKGKRRLFHFI